MPTVQRAHSRHEANGASCDGTPALAPRVHGVPDAHLFVALPNSWKCAGLYRLVKLRDCIVDAPRSIPKRTDKFRFEIWIQAEEILEHQNLAIACRARANADRRNPKSPGDLACEFRRDAF